MDSSFGAWFYLLPEPACQLFCIDFNNLFDLMIVMALYTLENSRVSYNSPHYTFECFSLTSKSNFAYLSSPFFIQLSCLDLKFDTLKDYITLTKKNAAERRNCEMINCISVYTQLSDYAF